MTSVSDAGLSGSMKVSCSALFVTAPPPDGQRSCPRVYTRLIDYGIPTTDCLIPVRNRFANATVTLSPNTCSAHAAGVAK